MPDKLRGAAATRRKQIRRKLYWLFTEPRAFPGAAGDTPAFNQIILKALLYRLRVVRYNLGGILLWLTFSRK